VSLAPPARPHPAGAYDEVRDRWTRSDRIIVVKSLDTTLQVYGTFFSLDFISAVVARRAQLFQLPERDRGALEAGLRAEVSKGHLFLISAAASDWSWNDLERRDSVWRIALLNDRGEQVSALEIKAEKITATTLELFPYVNSFHRVYTLRFPLALPDGRPLVREDAREVVLLFAGPLGQARLRWRLR